MLWTFFQPVIISSSKELLVSQCSKPFFVFHQCTEVHLHGSADNQPACTLYPCAGQLRLRTIDLLFAMRPNTMLLPLQIYFMRNTWCLVSEHLKHKDILEIQVLTFTHWDLMMSVMRLLWHVTQASDTAKQNIHETEDIKETYACQTRTNIMLKYSIWHLLLTVHIWLGREKKKKNY